jgi:hypothetical protein
MGLIRGALDRIVLVAAILASGCVPSFIAQYRQRVGGRLDQVVRDLKPFQDIAQRDFGGSLNALIEHHRASADTVFPREGIAIQQMVDAAARLRDAVRALDTDLYGQIAWLLRHADLDLVGATWSAWQPSFDLSYEGLTFAVCAGLVLWLAFQLLWYAVAASARAIRGHRGAARS